MINNAVSFGRKIPVATCQVKDKEKDKFTKAIVYEFDCKDRSDMEELKDMDGYWDFKTALYNDMLHTRGRKLKGGNDNTRYFVMEDKKSKDIIGISEVSTEGTKTNIDYIESENEHKYKYVGQTLIAAIGTEVLYSGGTKLTVDCPIRTALSFYEKTCKFDKSPKGKLQFEEKGLKKFIKRTEKRTKSKILNVKV